ncbi:MAG TPA: glutathione S-transferase [Phenylobacterium sp.]
MARRGITLYHSPASRAFTAYWMLEELGVPFQVETVDIRKGEQKKPEYLKLNPAGKVPTVTDGDAVVSENPAICIFLADRYAYGRLAPKIEDPRRGPYLKWMVYSTAVVEPVRALHAEKLDLPGYHHGFGEFDAMVEVLKSALAGKRYFLGDEFSAVDVMLGSVISTSLFSKLLPEDPVFLDYNARLTCREAYHRAADATWPKWLFDKS